MAVSENELRIAVVLDANDASAKLGELNSELNNFESINTSDIDNMSDSVSDLGDKSEASSITQVAAWAAITVAITKAASALKEMVSVSIESASAYEESVSRVQFVFDEVNPQLQEAMENLQGYGYSLTDVASILGSTGDVLTGTLGMADDAALEMSENLAELGADLASFTNYEGGAAGASEVLLKAILGEREALIGLGLKISEEMVSQKALEMGLVETTGEIDNQTKAIATYSLLVEQSENAIGDLERTQDSYANTIRASENATENLKVSYGNLFLGIATFMAGAAADFKNWLAEAPGLMGAATVAIASGLAILSIAAISATGAFAALGTALAAVTAPVWIAIGAAVALSSAVVGITAAIKNIDSNRIDNLSESMSNLEEAAESGGAGMVSALEDVEKAVDKLEKSYERLGNRLDRLNNREDRVQARIDALEEEKSALLAVLGVEDEASAAALDRNNLTQDQLDILDEIANIDEDIEKKNERLEKITGKITDTTAEQAEISGEVADAIETAAENGIELSTTIDTANTGLEAAAGNASDVAESLNDAYEKWLAISGAIDDYDAAITRYNDKIEKYLSLGGTENAVKKAQEFLDGGFELGDGSIFQGYTADVEEFLKSIDEGTLNKWLDTTKTITDETGNEVEVTLSALDARINLLETAQLALQTLVDNNAATEEQAALLETLNDLLGTSADLQGEIANANGDAVDSLNEATKYASEFDTVMAQIASGEVTSAEGFQALGMTLERNQNLIDYTNALLKDGAILTQDQLDDYTQAVSENQKINDLLGEQKDKNKESLSAIKKMAAAYDGAADVIEQAVEGVMELANELGITYDIAAGLSETDLISTSEEGMNELVDTAISFTGNLASALTTGNPTAIIGAVIDGAKLLIQIFDRVNNTLNKIKEETQDIVDNETMTNEEKKAALQNQIAQLEALKEHTKRKKKQEEIDEEIKSVREEILDVEEDITAQYAKQAAYANAHIEYLEAGGASIAKISEAYDYLIKSLREQYASTTDWEEKYQLLTQIIEAQEAQANLDDEAAETAQSYLETQIAIQEELLKQASTTEEQEAIQAKIDKLESEYLKALEDKIDTADTQAEKAEYYLELLEAQNEALEEQADLADGLTDSQQALIDSLQEQIELGLLSEANVADVSNIISQLSAAGISGTTLASEISDLGISGLTAGSAGYNTSIGSVNVYNATDETLDEILNGSITGTI